MDTHHHHSFAPREGDEMMDVIAREMRKMPMHGPTIARATPQVSGPTFGQWVSVKDRWPAHPGHGYLVWREPSGIYIMLYWGGDVFKYNAREIRGITHWMPLPDEPTA